jgi:hypothetical protein
MTDPRIEHAMEEFRKFFASRYIEEAFSSFELTIWKDMYLCFRRLPFEFLVKLMPVNTFVGYESMVTITYLPAKAEKGYPSVPWNVELTYPSLWNDNPDSPLKDANNLGAFLDAVNNPKLWPLCIHIPWAQELVSHMLKNL